jgi:LAO/AO transport system kinase
VTAGGTGVGNQPAELLVEAANGNRVALARLLSIIERGGAPSREVARATYRGDTPYTVGLTGAPGAGKSTLTDRLILEARKGWAPAAGDTDDSTVEPVAQVAVLAVDPSSPFTGGAILGDRVRMQEHALDPTVFIRSMATRGHLGGLALAVPDAVRLLGASGFPVVLVETVGVGQMEVEVAAQADTTIVVVTPGWGDAMQANKAGLLEVADLFVINKADRPGARDARRDLEQMLDLSPPLDWRPPVLDTSATSGEGIEELWQAIGDHRRFLAGEGRLERRRGERLTHELRRALMARLEARVGATAGAPSFEEVRKRVLAGELDPYEAADLLLDAARAPDG